ncbi:MAG: hypothetical protein AAF086_06570, partial [Planctomycetota bacterium]
MPTATAHPVEPGTMPLSEEKAQALRPITGLWVWQDRWVSDITEQDKMLDFAERYGINLFLVQIHQIGGGTLNPRLAYPKQLARLIEEAGKRGITVEALDGAKDQASAENQPATLAILKMILEFNAGLTGEYRLGGVHYDIEPYILPGWQEAQSRQVIMYDLVDFFADAKQMIAEDEAAVAMGFTLSSDIPMWYDAMGQDATLEFNGKTANLHQHIQDLCDYIGIMSYRTHGTGDNSVSYHIENEVAYAESIGKFVCGALETLELPDTPQITFYGKSAESFF